MNAKFLHALIQSASLKNAVLLGILLLIMSGFIMPEAAKEIRRYAPGVDLIDNRLCCSPAETFELLDIYGERGRASYMVVELTADLFLWIVIAAFLIYLLMWSASKLNIRILDTKSIVLLPLLSMIANCLENAGIIWMLAQYPQKNFYLAIITSVFTLIKWLILTICTALAAWHLILLSQKKKDVLTSKSQAGKVAEEHR